MDEMRFDGRVAIVTGAGRGIGREYALLLASRGAAVVVNDLGGTRAGGDETSTAPADEVVQAITDAGGQAVANYDSVATASGAEGLAEFALESFGHVDVLINNAGIVRWVPFDQTSDEVLQAHLDVHLFGAWRMCQALWPHFVSRDYGRIINTTAGATFGTPLMTAYTAAKGAVFAFSRTLATECGERNIRVNLVAPGAATRMMLEADMPQDVKDWAIDEDPPALVAPAAAFLAHESCSLNGETLSLIGGHVRRIGLTENEGIFDKGLTPEVIREQLPTILDETSAEHWPDTYTQSRVRMARG